MVVIKLRTGHRGGRTESRWTRKPAAKRRLLFRLRQLQTLSPWPGQPSLRWNLKTQRKIFYAAQMIKRIPWFQLMGLPALRRGKLRAKFLLPRKRKRRQSCIQGRAPPKPPISDWLKLLRDLRKIRGVGSPRRSMAQLIRNPTLGATWSRPSTISLLR